MWSTWSSTPTFRLHADLDLCSSSSFQSTNVPSSASSSSSSCSSSSPRSTTIRHRGDCRCDVCIKKYKFAPSKISSLPTQIADLDSNSRLDDSIVSWSFLSYLHVNLLTFLDQRKRTFVFASASCETLCFSNNCEHWRCETPRSFSPVESTEGETSLESFLETKATNTCQFISLEATSDLFLDQSRCHSSSRCCSCQFIDVYSILCSCALFGLEFEQSARNLSTISSLLPATITTAATTTEITQWK